MSLADHHACLHRDMLFSFFSQLKTAYYEHRSVCVCNFLLKIISDNNFYYTFIIIYFYSHTLLKSFVVMCSHISKKSRMCIKSYFNYVIKIKSSAILLDIILLFMKFYNNFIDSNRKSFTGSQVSSNRDATLVVSIFFCIKIIN